MTPFIVFIANSLTSRLVLGSPNNSAKAIATSFGFFLPNISTALFLIPIFIFGSLATDVRIGTTWSVPIAPRVSVNRRSVLDILLFATS